MSHQINRLLSNHKKFSSGFISLFFIGAQLASAALPIILTSKALAAQSTISVSDHEGQLKPSGTYTNGNVTSYKELDTINFRYTLTASDSGSGQMQVRFTGIETNGQDCDFFQQLFSLGSIDSVSGLSPTVTKNGSPTQDGDEWVQLLDVSFAGAGEAKVNYALTLTDEAGDCGGSSQHSRLDNGPVVGDIKNIGSQNVPVPAKDIVELGKITVTKYVDTDGDGQADRTASENEWSFSLDGATAIPTDENGQVVFSDLKSGDYTVTESGPDGYSFLGLSGTNCKPSTRSGSAIATITTGTSAVDAACDFTNGARLGSITIVKNSIPDSQQDFNFTSNISGHESFALDDESGANTDNVPESITFSDLAPGSYNFSEQQTEGWYLDDISCPNLSEENDISEGSLRIDLAAGQNVTCTFKNRKLGTITVYKQTDPANDQTPFEVTASTNDGEVINDISQNVTTSSPVVYQVKPGTYNISENPGDLWDQTENSCTQIKITNQNLNQICLIKNKKKPSGKIIVHKVVWPYDDNGKFDLLIDDEVKAEDVGSGGSTGIVEVPTGTHKVSEKAGTDTDMSNYNSYHYCWSLGYTSPLSLGTVINNVQVKPYKRTIFGEVKTECWFYNKRLPTITIVKNAVPDSKKNFNFTTSFAGSFTLDDDGNNSNKYSNQKTFDRLQYWNFYTFHEQGNPNWELEDINCTGVAYWYKDLKSRNLVVFPDIGDNVVCTFTNAKDSTLTVEKDAYPADGTDFDFHVSSKLSLDDQVNDKDVWLQNLLNPQIEKSGYWHDFTLDDGQDQDQYTNKEKLKLKPGTYYVTEDQLDGWDLTKIKCSGAEYSVNDGVLTIYVNAGQKVHCKFVNKKRAEVIVTKFNDYDRNGYQDEGEPSLPDWDINLSSPEECFVIPSASTNTLVAIDDCYKVKDYDKTQTTGEDGTTTFTDVKSYKPYYLSEYLKDDWYWSNTYCEYDQSDGEPVSENNYELYAYPGETLHCYIGNYQDPELELSKFNDSPEPLDNGESVTYTLKVSLPEESGALFDTEVTDLPPEGFKYVTGSWTASSSIRGDLKEDGTTTEPPYGSPGLWNLGKMLPGEIVTLTYRAVIGDTVTPGVYPDLAFASGYNCPSCVSKDIVYSNSFADSPFVGTEVSLVSTDVVPISKTTLVNTGGQHTLIYVALASLLMIAAITVTRVQTTSKGGRK